MKKSLTILLMMVLFSCEIVTKPTYSSNQNMVGDLSIRKDGRACNEPHKILDQLFVEEIIMKKKDLTGQKFSRLLVLKEESTTRTGVPKNNKTRWLCQCDCGNQVVVKTGSLRSGNTKSCGCRKVETIGQLELSGKRFGRLIAVDVFGRSKEMCVIWFCLCDCGKETTVRASHLKSGQVKSCGCLRKEVLDKTGKYKANALSRSSKRYDKWRHEVFERDKNTCQKCGKTNKHLHAHHIINFDENVEFRFEVENGMTLCSSCHKKIHWESIIR